MNFDELKRIADKVLATGIQHHDRCDPAYRTETHSCDPFRCGNWAAGTGTFECALSSGTFDCSSTIECADQFDCSLTGGGFNCDEDANFTEATHCPNDFTCVDDYDDDA